VVYITQGLARTLLGYGRDRDPDSITIPVAVSDAAALEGAELPAETQVFSHFYLPSAGQSVSSVFGVDLGTPPGQTQGRFVSHPNGELEISKRDDLAEVVFVAVPPWEESALAAFDRRGRRQQLEVIAAEPPEEQVR